MPPRAPEKRHSGLLLQVRRGAAGALVYDFVTSGYQNTRRCKVIQVTPVSYYGYFCAM